MRIKDKIEEIEKYLQELNEIIPASFENYQSDFKTKAACERYAERIIEAVIDLIFLVIKEKSFKIPEEEKEIFEILTNEKIISQDLGYRLRNAKGMRNILVHQYENIDDDILFEAITTELEKDVLELLKNIKKLKLY